LILNYPKQIFLQNRQFYQVLLKIKEFGRKWQNLNYVKIHWDSNAFYCRHWRWTQ